MKSYVIGIDGGGTKTEAVLVDLCGDIIKKVQWGSTNYQVLGGHRLKEEITALLFQIQHDAGITTEAVKKIVLGLAGAGRATDREAIVDLFTETVWAGRVIVESDAAVALAGAFAMRPGIILIAGTGSICFGKGLDGKIVRSGGWGYLLGDGGSGYAMGRDAIASALKDLDGTDELTDLRSALEQSFGLECIDEIIPLVYQDRVDRIGIANLAPTVFNVAESGDTVARNIVKKTGQDLGILVRSVVQRLHFSNEVVQIALIGSLFHRKTMLIPEIRNAIQGAAKSITFIEPEFSPPIGAALIALEYCCRSIDDQVFQRLRGS